MGFNWFSPKHLTSNLFNIKSTIRLPILKDLARLKIMAIYEFSGFLNLTDPLVPRPPVFFNEKRYGADYYEDVAIQLGNIFPGESLKLKFSLDGSLERLKNITLLNDRGILAEVKRSSNGEIDFIPDPDRQYYVRVQNFVGAYGNSPEPFKLQIETPKDTIVGFGKYEGQVPYYKYASGAYNHHDYPDAGRSINTPINFIGNLSTSNWVYGGNGNDLITGSGNAIDQFAGGGGNDLFVIGNGYGNQIDRGFAIIWDLVPGEDRIQVIGNREDFFFVRDDSAWLNNQSFLQKAIDTSAIPNTILARRDPGSGFGAVMVAAISDAVIGLEDLDFQPYPQFIL
jgi:hypothetical protein